MVVIVDIKTRTALRGTSFGSLGSIIPGIIPRYFRIDRARRLCETGGNPHYSSGGPLGGIVYDGKPHRRHGASCQRDHRRGRVAVYLWCIFWHGQPTHQAERNKTREKGALNDSSVKHFSLCPLNPVYAFLDSLFQVDEAGGMTKFIDSGAAKLRIEEAATRAQVGCSISPAVVQILLAG